MNTKTCTKCGEERLLTDFCLRKRGLPERRPDCRKCRAKARRKWYERNREEVIKKSVKGYTTRRNVNRANLLEYFETHHCVDCGEKHPATLQFDHVRGVKRRNVSQLIQHASWSTVKDEIAKCDVRCANCHAKKTAKDYNWFSKGE